MRMILFSSKSYDQQSFRAAKLPDDWQVSFQEARLNLASADLAAGCEVVCAFINDDLSAPVLRRLAAGGTRQIGLRFARIMAGFGCQLLINDPRPVANLAGLGARQVELDELIERSDIISLHCPLNAATHHLINAPRLQQMKAGVMLINTGRGALIDTPALIGALKSGQLGYLGLDVYEEEAELFYEDHSDLPLQDDVLARLLSFPNVLITAQQAFLTHEALAAIATTTRDNIAAWLAGTPINLVHASA